MFERLEGVGLPRLAGQRERVKLWNVSRHYHCAIVGTCFTPEDMAWLCRRLKLVMAPGTRDYDIHRTFVEQAGVPGPAAKLMTKRLDEKFSGEIRRFAREKTAEGWAALWEAAVASGNVAPAFWALVGHAGVPDELRVRAYSEVHMLSHLMGGENRRSLRANQELNRRCAELAERLARTERASVERVAEKDARIRALEQELAQARATLAAREAAAREAAAPARNTRLEKELAVLRRRVTAERMRARLAEGEVERLHRLLDGASARPKRAPAGEGAVAIPMDAFERERAAALPAAAATPRDLGGQSILYVGGRPNLMPHIRAAVESRNGCLLHHDGGVEKATRCLEGLVERADVVVCPIDCISHDACLQVKGLCRRMRKRFMPIRSSGATSFTRALGALGTPGGGDPAEMADGNGAAAVTAP
ncbi:DUF2325 domain-containing protein [Azospirillum sp. SYSU D00513]|uniref:DUF2325 domain-containing protein n=1 Tax=Azospirillum sp. SYSU D00513 TaxID=2812561 RepID=UPI001FFFF054|nr:DUF2325 domain-containing protein [Azospirillum sp. SYSU D00513]